MFTLHRAERADTLVVALADVLATPPDDVFTPEVVAVPAKGVERWLAQQMSTRFGVAANITFPHPNQLVADALAAAHGIEPDDDPWVSGRLVWTLLEVIDDCLGEPWCALLAHHLGADAAADSPRRGRRYSAAALLAGLFTDYGENRPSMLTDWVTGRDTDGAGAAIEADLAWQAELWRRLRERIGTPSPAERLTGACERLIDEPGLLDLPGRVSLFGPTRLTRAQLAVIEALAVHRDIHLWLTHPSPAMWDALAGRRAPPRRADDDSALLLSNPLLAGLSRDVRELQQRLTGRGDDIYHPAAESAAGTLAAVRGDIGAERAPGATGRIGHDGSIAIHACHGPARQVEVLRESLLGLLEADDTLQPRDIIVMCPDVDTFAPLISAAFGQPDAEHPGHRLRVRLADRGLAFTNPLLETLSAVLRLADGRATASEVLDLAATGPVARRFGFTVDALETLRSWTGAAGARWALGERQRAAYGLAGVRQNTFSTALDRILLGVAADESDLEWLGLALPLDDVDSNDVELAGRFAEYIDRLSAVVGRLTGEQPAGRWTEVLDRALDALTDVPDRDLWQRTQAARVLAAATEHAGGVMLRLADVRSMLAGRLAARPTRANFRTGELTVCTLVPMRSVPHRVVALLGLDDETFPRPAAVNGDDILTRNPCLGERDPRSEDRQLLLDAVMSATERLLVCYTGADPVTGKPRPPSAPLGELIDTVAATVSEPDAVVTRHPLQPFDGANFAPPAPFSFDAQAFAAARAGQQPPAPVPPFLPAALPANLPDRSGPAGDVALDDLVEFLTNPARAFLRQRLGIILPRADDDIDDALPLVLDGLEKWDIGDRMLSAALAGATVADIRNAELRRGTLPTGALGTTAVADLANGVTVIRDAAAPYLVADPATVDVSVDLTDGRRLSGTVAGVHSATLLRACYSALSAKHRIAAWVRLLAVAAATGTSDWQAVTIGRTSADASSARRSTLAVPPDPTVILEQLVDVRERGMREPLPLAPKTSATYAGRRLGGATVDDARDDAATVWNSSMRKYGENSDDAIAYTHGTSAPFEQLWDAAPYADERWSPEPTRFAVLARRVWDPLLAGELLGPA